MSDDDISKISSVFERYKRYADISCSTLSSLVHESDILEYCDCVPIINIDMSWLFHIVDGMIIITDDPKRVDLTNIEIGLMIMEVLIYIRSCTENEDIEDIEILSMFKTEIYKSMNQYSLSYAYSTNFDITVLSNIMNLVYSGLSTHDPLAVLGWVNNKTKMLSVIEGV